MEFEKVIFLDVDGTLATKDCYLVTEMKFGKRIYKWNPLCVAILNEVIHDTGAVIVLSSDWRRYFTREDLDGIFKWNDVIVSPVAVTDTDKYKLSSNIEIDRIHQIGRFLKNNSIKNWVALDDLDLKSDIVTNFVQMDCEEGISAKGIKEKLILFLNKN
jgi:hypothetical protein